MIKYLRFFILALISTSAFTNAFAVNPFFTIPTLFCFFIALLYFLIIANTKFKFNIDKGVSLFFFCIVFTITTLINQRGEKTINQYILWIFSFLFFYFALRNSLCIILDTKRYFIKNVFTSLFYVVLFASLFAIAEFSLVNFGGIDLAKYIPRGTVSEYTPLALLYIRARSFMEESGQFALFLECLAPIAIAYCSLKYNKIVTFIYLTVIVLSMLVSFSAYGFVALVICFFIYIYYIATSKKTNNLTLIRLFLILTFLFVLLYALGLFDLLFNIISSKLDPDQSSSYNDRQDRVISLSNYFYGINLFIGYGAGAYSSLNISSLVSFYVGILLNTGILGILLYSLFIITQARMIFRIEELRFKAAFFMSFVIATTHYLFVDNIYVSWYWIMLSLAYCFYKYNFNQLDLK